MKKVVESKLTADVAAKITNLLTLVDGVSILNQIKTYLEINDPQLSEFLSEGRAKKVAEATPYYWDKKDIWPSWALRKCRVIN